jgi:hypothetical protein
MAAAKRKTTPARAADRIGDPMAGSRVVAAVKAAQQMRLALRTLLCPRPSFTRVRNPGDHCMELFPPANPAVPQTGDPSSLGKPNDPMLGKSTGGVIVSAAAWHSTIGKGKIIRRLGHQRRYSVRRSHHCLENPPRPQTGLCSHGRRSGSGAITSYLDMTDGHSASGFGTILPVRVPSRPDEILKRAQRQNTRRPSALSRDCDDAQAPAKPHREARGTDLYGNVPGLPGRKRPALSSSCPREAQFLLDPIRRRLSGRCEPKCPFDDGSLLGIEPE